MLIELSIYMMRKHRAKAIKHSLVVDTLSVCKTILQSSARVALSSLLILSMVSCGPGGSQGPTQYITNYGSDKKLPDDDGYTGSGGTGDGGGGQGILCSADVKNPEYRSKLFVRDIFEGIYNSKLKMKTMSGPFGEGSEKVGPESIKFLISTLKSFYGPAMQQLEIGREEFWQEFVSRISFLDEDVRLYPSQDANSPIALPNGCKIVQIAYWDDSTGRGENGTLYIDRAQWKKLDSLNKVALLAHEYFFKEARIAGYKNSDLVRSQLAQIFSNSNIKPLFPEGSQLNGYCKGTNQADPHSVIHLYTASTLGARYLVIPYFRSSNISISSLKGQSFRLPDDRVQKALEDISSMSKKEFSNKISPDSSPKGWAGYFNSASTNIRISIENPFVIKKARERVITKSDVRMKIFGKIKDHLIETVFKNEPSFLENELLMRAYIHLNAEIDTFIQKGEYPKAFLSWHSELYNLINSQKDEKLRGTLNFRKVVIELPMLLYKYRTELISEQELESLFEDDKRYSEDTYSIQGIAKGEKGNENIYFELTCYSGSTVFASQPENNILKGSPVRAGDDKVPFQFQYSDFRTRTDYFDEEYYRGKIETMLSAALSGHKTEIDPMTKTASLKTCDLYTIDGCSDEHRLAYKLARTKSVNVYRCHSPNWLNERFEVTLNSSSQRRCIVIEIPEEKMYYEMKLVEQNEKIQDEYNVIHTSEVSLVPEPSYLDTRRFQERQAEGRQHEHNPNDPGP
ncbi:hypothetical protein AZI86_18160 [Bdellovibrio bacteriovorus]|uniref:Uncharacterized protein n=2 Tax=Bdellovibrio bacteriovorus TaxID=959 RepID=A0A150WET9_BDEBC|nr:hypothetical protein AZI86_18160 [Bdellovibrio bacteriovorus]